MMENNKRKNSAKNAYSSFINRILRIFRWFSNIFDRLIYSHGTLVVLAVTAIVCASIYFSTGTNTVVSSSKTLNNVATSAIYNSETFELTGLPNTCNVTIIGDSASVTTASNRTGSCVANLEGYGEGTYNVSITATGYGDSVSTVVEPSQATLTLKRKTSVEYNVSYDFINQNQMSKKYVLGTPTFADGSDNKVYIRASEDTLKNIAMVKALIDVSGKTESFDVDAPIVAYDSNGNVINADISPSTVTMHVEVSSPSKTIPIVLKTTGSLPTGKSINSITLDSQSTTIYGYSDKISSVDSISVTLDLSSITSDSNSVSLPVTLPDGVNDSDVSIVNVTVTLADSTTTTISGLPILYKNNTNNYGAEYVRDTNGNDITNATVTITGAASVINSLTADDFNVYIDLNGVSTGVVTLKLNVECTSDKESLISYSIEPVEVVLNLVETK